MVHLGDNYTIPRAIRELWHTFFTNVKKSNYTIPRAIRELWLVVIYGVVFPNYTIPRAIRELWRFNLALILLVHYTIPRAIRELWRSSFLLYRWSHYTIPRAIRELWLEYKAPNTYDCHPPDAAQWYIIPYQELLGNYDLVNVLHIQNGDYTIPRAIRELWRIDCDLRVLHDYTIPRAIRELWPVRSFCPYS